MNGPEHVQQSQAHEGLAAVHFAVTVTRAPRFLPLAQLPLAPMLFLLRTSLELPSQVFGASTLSCAKKTCRFEPAVRMAQPVR